MRVVPLTLRIVSKVDLLYIRIIMDVYLVIIMFHKKDGGISVVAKKRSAIGTFFDNHYKSKPTCLKSKASGGDVR